MHGNPDVSDMAVPTDRGTFNSYPFWSPRFWAGMRFGHWFQLLSRNGFRVHPSRFPWALLTTLVAPGNTALYGLQRLVFGRRISATEPVAPPVFILGHWRTGTTFLQELLWHDPRLATPSNYQTYATNHFLLTERVAQKYLKFLLPRKRPMDNVTLQWDSPQEDEWARVTMGLPSPYLRVAFSSEDPPYEDYLDMAGLSAAEIDTWQQGFHYFLKCVTLRTGKRLVFKSPLNTGRLRLLHQMFPDAKFIHVTRHPFIFFPSTLRMHRAFDFSQSLQKPRDPDGLEACVLKWARRMYESYNAYRPEVPEHQIIDVRYDELTQDPMTTMRRVYQHLDLGPIEPALAGFEKYLGPRKNYVTNRHQLPKHWQDEICRELSQYFDSFGYDRDDEG
ncbi:MAG: sulfotransferase [Fuerstiella sp.]